MPQDVAVSDSAMVVELLEEATEALAAAELGFRADRRLVYRLVGLREAWGLDGGVAEGLYHDPYAELRDLAEAGEHVRAAGLLLAWDPPIRRVHSLSLHLINALARRGDDELTLAVARWFDRVTYATESILEYGGGSEEERRERVRGLLQKGEIPSRDEVAVAAQLLAGEGRDDPEAAWARTAHVDDQRRRIAFRMKLLSSFGRGVPEVDEWLRMIREEIRLVRDARERVRLLKNLGMLCDRQRWDVCAELEVPLQPPAHARRFSRTVVNALAEGEFEEVRLLLDSLGGHYSPEEVAEVVLRGLSRAPGPRPRALEAEKWVLKWTERALRLAEGMEAGLADPLLAEAVPLLARSDPARALRTGENIVDDELRQRAYAQMARTLLPVDEAWAWKAARRAPDHPNVRSVALQLYPRFRSRGAREDAREALEVMGLASAATARFRWAERQHRAGRWTAARRTVREVLADWEAAERPFGFAGVEPVFARLNMCEELLKWARSLERAGPRAIALVEIVSAYSSRPTS